MKLTSVHCFSCDHYYNIPVVRSMKEFNEILDQCVCPKCQVPRNKFRYKQGAIKCSTCSRIIKPKTPRKKLCNACYIRSYRQRKITNEKNVV